MVEKVTTPLYRDVKASGIRLRVTEAGDGPALLLLHSTLLNRSSWAKTLTTLSKSFRVVVPDLPGFGESEKPAQGRFAYSVPAFAHVVTDLFAGLGLGQACVAGHGLGGAIGISIASQSPELVSRLVLVDSMCYPARPDAVRRVTELPLAGGFVFKQLWGKTMFRSYFREALSSPARTFDATRIEDYYEAFNTPASRNSALATFQATRDTRAVVADVARINVPCLVVWGRHDAVYPASDGRRLSREIRSAGFELLDSGHVPMEEQPDEFARVLTNFCLSKRA